MDPNVQWRSAALGALLAVVASAPAVAREQRRSWPVRLTSPSAGQMTVADVSPRFVPGQSGFWTWGVGLEWGGRWPYPVYTGSVGRELREYVVVVGAADARGPRRVVLDAGGNQPTYRPAVHQAADALRGGAPAGLCDAGPLHVRRVRAEHIAGPRLPGLPPGRVVADAIDAACGRRVERRFLRAVARPISRAGRDPGTSENA